MTESKGYDRVENMKRQKNQGDPFYQYRQRLKGVFVVTAGPKSFKVLAKALDYRSLREKMSKKEIDKTLFAIKYLEPKEAICAYATRVSL